LFELLHFSFLFKKDDRIMNISKIFVYIKQLLNNCMKSSSSEIIF